MEILQPGRFAGGSAQQPTSSFWSYPVAPALKRLEFIANPVVLPAFAVNVGRAMLLRFPTGGILMKVSAAHSLTQRVILDEIDTRTGRVFGEPLRGYSVFVE